MILQMIFNPVFILLSWLVSLLPEGAGLPEWINACLELIGYGLAFFPIDIWVFMVGNFIFWQVAHMGWAIFEWIYKKIPGVD